MISIVEPIYDPQNDPVHDNFTVSVNVTDTNGRLVQVKIIGQSWASLEQSSTYMYDGKIDISMLTDGLYQITARYIKNAENQYYYVPITTKIQVKNPLPPTKYGYVKFTFIDENDATVKDVVVQPSGNKSDYNGVAYVGNLSLTTETNITFAKDGFKDNFLIYLPPNSDRQDKEVRMLIKEKYMRAYNFIDIVELNAAYYIQVIDDKTGKPIKNAIVKLRDMDDRVIQLNGNTSSSGRLLIGFNDAGDYNLLIEADGYEELVSDMITVVAPRTTPTPTPTPTPIPVVTPVPTPTMYDCPAAGMQLPIELCAQVTTKMEIKNNEINAAKANASIPVPVQEKPTETPIYAYGIIVLMVGIVTVVGYNKFKPKKEVQAPLMSDVEREDILNSMPTKKIEFTSVKCSDCGEEIQLPPNSDKELVDQIMAFHKNKEHKV